MTVKITHSHAEGTLLDGTSRGDGTAEVLKTKVGGWRWSRNIGWYVRQSRDKNANRAHIQRTKAALEAAGFVVDIDIDDTYRDTAEVEADKIERQEARVEALEAKAQRRAGEADAASRAHDHASDLLPPGGEPIHVGHHHATKSASGWCRRTREGRGHLLQRGVGTRVDGSRDPR